MSEVHEGELLDTSSPPPPFAFLLLSSLPWGDCNQRALEEMSLINAWRTLEPVPLPWE